MKLVIRDYRSATILDRHLSGNYSAPQARHAARKLARSLDYGQSVIVRDSDNYSQAEYMAPSGRLAGSARSV